MVIGSEITFPLYNHKCVSCEMNPCDEITMDQRNKQPGSRPPPKIATLFRIAEITRVRRHTLYYQGSWWSHNNHACTNHWVSFPYAQTFKQYLSLPDGERSSIPGIRKKLCRRHKFKISLFYCFPQKFFFYDQEASDQESLESGFSACNFKQNAFGYIHLWSWDAEKSFTC